MLLRSISAAGAFCIAEPIRGEGLSGEVVMYCAEGGVVIAPRRFPIPPGVLARYSKFRSLGRLVIPREVLRTAGIDRLVEVIVRPDTLLLKRAEQHTCVSCGSRNGCYQDGEGNYICPKCLNAR